MLLPHLMNAVEGRASDLVDELLCDVAVNPRTRYLHTISRDDLRRAILDLYTNLSRWLTEKDEREIEHAYARRGREAAIRGVPLSELAYALVLAKRHLWDFIRRNGIADTAMEILTEEEVALLIGEFFDKAIYHSVRGYEVDWLRQPHHAPSSTTSGGGAEVAK